MTEQNSKVEQAIFAAGCFWGVEYAFRQIEGVLDAEVGYTGGHAENPTYEKVCGGDTGHAEAVRVFYDPEKVAYETLVREFFKMHDPTTPNRQGPDVGHQYRSAIFYIGEGQKEIAEGVKDELDAEGGFGGPIVTEVAEAGEFYRAEEYHQRYFEKTGKKVC